MYHTSDSKSSKISKSFPCRIPSKHAFISVLTKYRELLQKKAIKYSKIQQRGWKPGKFFHTDAQLIKK